jgi:DNA-binding NtrC family response regulator
MKKDLNDLKKVVHDIVQFNQGSLNGISGEDMQLINKMYDEPEVALHNPAALTIHNPNAAQLVKSAQPIIIEESLSLADKEKDMITKALSKYKGKRKYAAKELGISERTLYRKINEYSIKE